MTDQADREADRNAFEQWYAVNAFNYERDPIGSRDCGLQRASWLAALAYAFALKVAGKAS